MQNFGDTFLVIIVTSLLDVKRIIKMCSASYTRAIVKESHIELFEYFIAYCVLVRCSSSYMIHM